MARFVARSSRGHSRAVAPGGGVACTNALDRLDEVGLKWQPATLRALLRRAAEAAECGLALQRLLQRAERSFVALAIGGVEPKEGRDRREGARDRLDGEGAHRDRRRRALLVRHRHREQLFCLERLEQRRVHAEHRFRVREDAGHAGIVEEALGPLAQWRQVDVDTGAKVGHVSCLGLTDLGDDGDRVCIIPIVDGGI
eukprot:1220410-Prymnesium_polylepis.1